MKNRIGLAALLLIGISVILCSKLFFTEVRGDKPPTPIVTTANGTNISIELASHAWKGVVDVAIKREQLIKAKKTVEVAPETAINVKFDYKPQPQNISVAVSMAEKEASWDGLTIKDGSIKAPKEKGIYIVRFVAQWKSGADAEYFFPIEVK